MRYLLALALSLLAVAPSSDSAYPGDVTLLRRVLETVHPGYDRYATPAELAAAWARLDSVAATSPSPLAFYAEVSRLLAVIRCDHTKAELPAALEAWRDSTGLHLPFRFRLFDRRMFVDVAGPGTGLARGDEILAIDGTPVAALVDSLAPLVAIDGFTEHVRPAKLEYDEDLYGSDFDTYLPAIRANTAASTESGGRLRYVLSVRPATPATRTTTPSSHRITVTGLTFPEWRALVPSDAARRDFGTATTLERLDDSTAVLRFPTFVNYRKPVDAKRFMDSLFAQVDAWDTRHLILDIGGGGSTEPVDELLRHLVAEPTVVTREARVRIGRLPDDLRPHAWTWNKDALDPPAGALIPLDSGWFALRSVAERAQNPLAPYPGRFAGRVTVLTSAQNASGSTMLIARLRDAGRVRLVGDSTGGSAEGPTAGVLLTLTLPGSGVRVRVPLVRSYVDIRHFTPGYGVAPDVLVRDSLEDWRAGRNRALLVAQR